MASELATLHQQMTPSVGHTPFDLPMARIWKDPDTETIVTFDTDHQFEVWNAFATAKYPVSLSHLCNCVQRWRDQGAMSDTATTFIKAFRKWWKKNGREDIAKRIKLTQKTVQFIPQK